MKLFTCTIYMTCVVSGFSQIPTIDVSSLQQLYAQYQTMQQQLGTAKNILNESTQIFNQEKQIYDNALGDISKIKSSVTGWVSAFSNLRNFWDQKGDWFQNFKLAPLQSFDNSVNYWANQIGGGYQNVKDMQTCWQTSINSVNSGVATVWESRLALSGYNSRLVDNARTSREYDTAVLNQSQSVVEGTKNGTIIEQAAAQNALIYQQTALLDKMKNDINDATVAEAAERDQKLKAIKDAEDIERARDNAVGP